ncbi:MAG: phasin family protein [Burkholderiaceae bacterium]|nr:phasin family protein [Burkholderiaceae bacterium]MCF8183381.1 phasin family protein [Polynucleobacter sp.]
MYQLPEQFVRANRASVETFTTFAQAAFSGAERVAALNLNAARSLLEEGTSTSRNWLAAKDVQDMVSLQATLARPDLGTLNAYSRRVLDITVQTQEALSDVVDARLSEINTDLDLALDTMVKNAPAGSDLALSAFRTSLSAVNSAYKELSRTAKQITEMAEANFAVAAATKPAPKIA